MSQTDVFAVHPGEVLREEFMRPLGLNANRLAHALGLSAPRINDIVLERRAVTANTALRLARYFGTSAQMWMNLQAEYDIRIEEKNLDLSAIEPGVPSPASKAERRYAVGGRNSSSRLTLVAG